MKKKDKRVNQMNTQETFRVLANQFKKYSQEGCKCIAFTSHRKEQGKSYIVQHLATALARRGSRTLIIDANFFQGTLTYMLGKSQEGGILDVLKEIGEISEEKIFSDNVIKQYIYDTGEENLYFLPKGGGGEKVVNEKFIRPEYLETLIGVIRASFEYILVEVPSFECLSYTQVITSVVDGCIIVLKSGELDIGGVNGVKQQIDSLECKVLSCILNKKEDISYKLPKIKKVKSRKIKNEHSQSTSSQVSEGVTI